mmetsp:Transcript_28710/g.31880  ORF Transcript_28710/g.31880 Transcript_28710/m.31880 type:complete len:175 (+) Transcript_28710:845-1369(+)
MLKLVLICSLIIAVAAVGFKNDPCNGGACTVQFKSMRFAGSVLTAEIENTGSSPIDAGNLVMETEGYGCIVFLCMWGEGPTLDDPTCSWPGMNCQNGNLINGGETKVVTMDFEEALEEAKQTTGCCSVDRSCNATPGEAGCMLRGLATFSNGGGDYAKVFVEFTCDLSSNECTV